MWGGPCGGIKKSLYAHLGAYETESTDYAQLSYVFRCNKVLVHESDVLVDVGCGKGRVINFWLGRGYRNRMVGIELDPEIADATRERLARYPNVEIVTADATQVLPADGTFFFLYNPFNEDATRRFVERLRHRRAIRVLYLHSKHANAFRDDPWWSVAELRATNGVPCVLIRPNADVVAERAGAAAGAGIDGPPNQRAARTIQRRML
jgi:SAM-dependent methyltransferase